MKTGDTTIDLGCKTCSACHLQYFIPHFRLEVMSASAQQVLSALVVRAMLMSVCPTHVTWPALKIVCSSTTTSVVTVRMGLPASCVTTALTIVRWVNLTTIVIINTWMYSAVSWLYAGES